MNEKYTLKKNLIKKKQNIIFLFKFKHYYINNYLLIKNLKYLFKFKNRQKFLINLCGVIICDCKLFLY